MADLVVTAAALEDSSARLLSIKHEFENADANMKVNGPVWGQRNLEDAMFEFTHDWGLHRKHIIDALGDLQKKIEQMVQGWDSTEQQLSSAITIDDSATGPVNNA